MDDRAPPDDSARPPQDHPEDPDEAISSLPAGRLRRAWRMARIMNEGVGMGLVRRKAREMLGTESVREKLRDDLNRELGLNLANSMGEMKGLVMKAGQMLSYLDNQLPSPLRATLSQLQTRVRPVETGRMKALFQEALGVPVEEAFASFDEEPLAAASVGQVYKAVLRDGRPVAVKIQYPEIVQVMENDLGNMGLMSNLGRMLNASVDEVVQELREALTDELDYRLEAQSQEAFRAIFAGDDLIVIPQVVPEWSRQTVLTTELMEGMSFETMLGRFDEDQRHDVSRAMGRFFYVAFYFYGMFNADPHPGNYLFLPDGRTVFLDFGCVRHFDRPFIDQQIAFVRALRRGSRRDIEELSVAMGIVPPENRHKVDWPLLMRFFELSYQPIVTPGPFRFTDEHNREVALVTLELKKKHVMHLRMPRRFVFLNRINFGLNALYARLDLPINYYERASSMMDFYDAHLAGQPIPDPTVEHIDYRPVEAPLPRPAA